MAKVNKILFARLCISAKCSFKSTALPLFPRFPEHYTFYQMPLKLESTLTKREKERIKPSENSKAQKISEVL
jgi:hypothetical protein